MGGGGAVSYISDCYSCSVCYYWHGFFGEHINEATSNQNIIDMQRSYNAYMFVLFC